LEAEKTALGVPWRRTTSLKKRKVPKLKGDTKPPEHSCVIPIQVTQVKRSQQASSEEIMELKAQIQLLRQEKDDALRKLEKAEAV
jgi:hypothetical protein